MHSNTSTGRHIDAAAGDPFVPEVAEVLVAGGFPASEIGWLELPADVEAEMVAAMEAESGDAELELEAGA